jgi:hypothetical protein
VITLATLLITGPPAATPSSVSDGGNAGAAAPANMHSGVHDQAGERHRGIVGDDQAGERHQKIVGDYLPADSPLRDK